MLNERELTKTELEKREKAMMDLKANKRSFVKRYGKDAEAVMYGRATNIAKKQAENMNKEKLRELIKSSLQGPVKEIDVEVGADRYEEEGKLATASNALDQLEAKLKSHDWFYMMSDDNRAYQNGSAQQSDIRSIIKDLEGLGYGKDAKDLYNQYAPYREGGPDFRMKEAKGKDMDKDGDIDSDDYLAARDAAIKKAKGEIKEDWGSSDQSAMNQSIHRDLGNPTEFPGLSQIMSAAEDAVDFYWEDWDEYETDRKGLVMYAAQMYANKMFPEFMAGMRRMMEPLDEKYANHPVQVQLRTKNAKSKKDVKEDMDLGHEDNEPHMLKADLYRIGKYAMELYQMVDQFEGQGEVDFPHWWQSKISNAKAAIVGAKHYLDFELKEPQIDAMVDVAQEEEAIDEGIGTIALGVAGGLALLKALKFVGGKILKGIASNVPLPKEKLLEVVSLAIRKSMQDGSSGINMFKIIGLKKFLEEKIEDGSITTIKQIQQVIEKASKMDIEEEVVNEGTWAVGSSSEIKKVMDLLDKAMDIKDPQALISMLEKSSKVMYNVVGDDLFHDDIDGAKSEAKEGNMDRAQNRLSDAYSRAEYFQERQMDREGLKEEEVGKADMVASDIQKAMNKHKGDDAKMYQLQKARTAMNKGDLDKAKKIAARLAEKLKSN